MRLTPESLVPALGRGLSNAYLVTGVEPLLIAEACDAIRVRARADGYGEREVHFVERGFDWPALLADANNLSLFSNRRLIELRITGAFDAESSKSLQALIERPPADTLLLVSGVVERKSLKNAWITAFERVGVLVIAESVGRRELPAWIGRRLLSRGVTVEPAAAELIADRVEGNLLAAQQEIERIALLMPGANVGFDDIGALVADSARYDVFELAGAALGGQAGRALRVLAGLRAEGEQPPLILWALLNDLRAVSRVSKRVETQRSVDDALRAEQVWSNRQGPVRSALQRLPRVAIDRLLVEAGRVDRLAKGSLRGDVWVALEALVARIAGVPSRRMKHPIGVFGGTFDPIHFGHLRTGFELLQALRLAEVRFIPAGNPPHREVPLADAALRLAMVRAATEGQAGFSVDDREVRREGPSYTVLTLSELRAEHPDRSLCLIVGMDAFLGLPKWHQWREILQLAHVVVAHRPGWRAPSMGPLGELLVDRGTGRVNDLHESVAGRIFIHPVTQLEISSTDLRSLIATGRDPRYLMPDPVCDIIRQTGCYARLPTR